MAEQATYHLSKKRFKMLGAEANIFEGNTVTGRHLLNAKMKAFKLWEDIRVASPDGHEAFLIRQRKEYKLGHTLFDVVDPAGTVLGSFQRMNFESMLQDKWNVLSPAGETVAVLQEDSMGLALLRRFLTNLVPQNYDLLGTGGQRVADLRQAFSLFGVSYELDATVAAGCPLDARLVQASMVLLATVEGRQQ